MNGAIRGCINVDIIGYNGVDIRGSIRGGIIGCIEGCNCVDISVDIMVV